MNVKTQRPGVTQTRLSNYLAKQIDALKGIKSQREIAADLGYNKANIISMFKTGEAKVPLDKLPALSRSLGVDLMLLLRLGIEQLTPDDNDAWVEITRAFDRVVTENEFEIVKAVREASGNIDPRLDDDRRIAIAKIFSEAV